jgi:putative FmdB family regulatory protein
MPIYEYRCEECGRAFEMLRRFSDADTDLKCPSCDSEEVERQISCFATSAGSGGGSTATGCGPAGGSRFR